MTTDLQRLKYITNERTIVIIVPSRRSTLIYFVSPLFVIFSIAAAVTIFPSFLKTDLPIIGKIIFFLFFLVFLHMGVTSLLALLWTLFGKDRITAGEKEIRVDRILFFCFSSSYYQKDRIQSIYVNTRDYHENNISRGRNDFMAYFRVGTVHFHYDGKLHHIAGGMTDEEGRIFLDKIGIQNLN